MRVIKVIFCCLAILSGGTGYAQWVVLDYSNLISIPKIDSLVIRTEKGAREMVLIYNASGYLSKSFHYDTLDKGLHSVNNFFYDQKNQLEKIVFESTIRRTDYQSGKVYRTKLKPFQTTLLSRQNDTLQCVVIIGDLVGLTSDTSKSFYKYYKDSVVVHHLADDSHARTIKYLDSKGNIDSTSYVKEHNRVVNNTIYKYKKGLLSSVEIVSLRDQDGLLYPKRRSYLTNFWYDKRGRLIKYKDRTTHHLVYYDKEK